MDFVPEKSMLEVDAKAKRRWDACLHDQAAKVRAQRMSSKMEMMKFRLPSWRVKRRN
jgi:hypothetical protein